MSESSFTYDPEADNDNSVIEGRSSSSLSRSRSRPRSLGSLASVVNGGYEERVGDFVQDYTTEKVESFLPWDPTIRNAIAQSTAMLKASILGPNGTTAPGIDMSYLFKETDMEHGARADGLPPLVAVKRESLLTLLRAFDQILLHEYS